MAEHEEGFVLTTVDSIINSVRRSVGAKAMDILIKLKKGEKVDAVTIAGLDIVTKENVDKFMK